MSRTNERGERAAITHPGSPLARRLPGVLHARELPAEIGRAHV